jgi:multicomponent Na+:H+ antiporter subunit E
VVWGALAAGVVTFLTHDLLYSRETAAAEEKIRVRLVLKQGWHLLAYLVWLLWSIVKANLQVAYLVLHPRMPVDPVLLQFRTRLPRNLAQVIIGNSITLTPGTVTVDLKEGRYTVHALVPKTAQDVIQGRLQKKVAAIFLQEEEAPRVSFIYSIEELER